jgi:hypothetical protein
MRRVDIIQWRLLMHILQHAAGEARDRLYPFSLAHPAKVSAMANWKECEVKYLG